ncbi:MAG: N-sulfoglucosamine sulfohydrolase [Saprospiraceae bacterium]|jgi:N-sulfoglucosamine sulfohydrolase
MMDYRQDEDVKQLFANTFEKRGSVQLYDIKNDPECIPDLSRDPAYAIIRGKLSIQLNALLLQQGDLRMSGSTIFDSYPRYSSMRNFDGFNTRGSITRLIKINGFNA